MMAEHYISPEHIIIILIYVPRHGKRITSRNNYIFCRHFYVILIVIDVFDIF